MRAEDDFRLMPEMTGLRSAKARINQGAESAHRAAPSYLIAAIHSLGIKVSDFCASGTLSWTPDPPWTAAEAATVAALNAAAFEPNTPPILMLLGI